MSETVIFRMEPPKTVSIGIGAQQSKTVSFHLKSPGQPGFNIEKRKVNFSIHMTISAGEGGLPYNGAYTVTPKLEQRVVLPTKNRTPKDDITVLQIPQYEVSNTAGGITLILGEEM